MLIGELAKRADCSRDTIRFYERIGLIKGSRNQKAGNTYKHYDTGMLERLDLVRKAKLLGFTLSEIKRIIFAWEADQLSRQEKIAIFEQKMRLVEHKLDELRSVRSYLRRKLEMLRGGEHKRKPARA